MAFTLRLPDDLDKALSAKSASTGVPKAVIARRAIERELGLVPGVASPGGMTRSLPSGPVPALPESTFRPDFKKGGKT
jgi:hypothetical protein